MSTEDVAALWEFFKGLPPVAGPTGDAAFHVKGD
jgi:hypothetical protein